MADWRLAVDIGGTFTDVVLLDAATGRVVVDKTLTTPSAPLEGVRTGVRQLLDDSGAVGIDEQTEFGLALAQLLLELRTGNGCVCHNLHIS